MSAGPRDIIVRCGPEGHRVRLAGGRRFWAGARCPRCGAAVDASRVRRVGAWLANLRRPAGAGRASPDWWRRRAWWATAVWWAVAVYLVGVVAAAVLVHGWGDRWWPATTLLFGPRWTLLLPLPGLAAAAVALDRVLLAPLALAGLVVLGPVMGFRTGWRALLVDERPADDLRVVTFNARGGETLTAGPGSLVADWNADVAAFQECGTGLRNDIARLPDWHTDAEGSLCLVSRFEILQTRSMDRGAFRQAGGSALVVTWTLALEDGPFHLTGVHLETPRAGLELIRSGRLGRGIPVTREKSHLRGLELERARSWVDDLEGPRLVVGDFNTPVESRAYRDAWGDWRNAFSQVGRGLGGTRLNGWIRTRIDHVLVDDGWTLVSARLGPDVGSDHLPVLADVRLR